MMASPSPRARGNFDTLTQAEMNELIDAKVAKEANRYIQRWPEDKIALENARWGPIIKFGKKIIRIPKKDDDTRYTPEEAAAFTIDQVKAFIEKEVPGAFSKKSKGGAKKAGA